MAIGRQEREGRVFVSLVFGEVKTNSANEVPRATLTRKKVLNTAGGVAHRILNSAMKNFPEAGQNMLIQIFTAHHRRGSGGMLAQRHPWWRPSHGSPRAR